MFLEANSRVLPLPKLRILPFPPHREYQRGDILVGKEEIERRIDEMAHIIDKKYHGQEVLLVGILTGAKKFTERLGQSLKHLGVYTSTDYIKIKSGWKNHQHIGQPEILQDIQTDPTGKIVILADDVFDEGHTLEFGREVLTRKGAQSVETTVLLAKPESAHEVKYRPDLIGFQMQRNGWAVGYGMDNGLDDGHVETERDLDYIFIGP
jgi:hypoxanthine phosphoribosyltransferase